MMKNGEYTDADYYDGGDVGDDHFDDDVGTVVLRMKTRNVAHVKVMVMMNMMMVAMLMMVIMLMNVMMKMKPG